MIPAEWFNQAAQRIAPHIRRTLLTNDAELNIYLKWENQQVTGSFKIRGALNKVLSLQPWELIKGLVTASAGNHGQGVALAGKIVGVPVTVFASAHAVATKVAAMQQLGATIHFVEGGYELAEETAIKHAAETDKMWISPYNDGQVIAGQGTIGMEIAEDLRGHDPMTLVVPCGGGGLLSGIGAALEASGVRMKIVGVNAAASPFMHALYTRGNQQGVADLPTLADGLSGAVETGSLTIPLVKGSASDLILADEEEIGRAISFAYHRYGQRIEGSAAVGLGVILSGKVKPPAAVIISGGNIQTEVFVEVCQRYPKP